MRTWTATSILASATVWCLPAQAARYVTFDYSASGDYQEQDCDYLSGVCQAPFMARAVVTGSHTFDSRDGHGGPLNHGPDLLSIDGPEFSLLARFTPVDAAWSADARPLQVTTASVSATMFRSRYQIPFTVPLRLTSLAVRSGDIAVANLAPTINVTPVPEPLAWTTLILGFGLAGLALRVRRSSGQAM